jgi:protein phosphatase
MTTPTNPLAKLRAIAAAVAPGQRTAPTMTTREYVALDLTGRIGADLAGAIADADRPYRVSLPAEDRKALAPLASVPEHLTLGEARELVATIRKGLDFFGTKRARSAIARAVLRLAAAFPREATRELTGGAQRPEDWLAGVGGAAHPGQRLHADKARRDAENREKAALARLSKEIRDNEERIAGAESNLPGFERVSDARAIADVKRYGEERRARIAVLRERMQPHAARLAELEGSRRPWTPDDAASLVTQGRERLRRLAEEASRVRLRPGPPRAPKRPPDTFPLTVACPQCLVGAGARCKNYKGQGCAPHTRRVRLALEMAEKPAAAAASAHDANAAALVLRAIKAETVLHATDRERCPITCGLVRVLIGAPRWTIFRYCPGGRHQEIDAPDAEALARLFMERVEVSEARRAALHALGMEEDVQEDLEPSRGAPALTEDTALDALRALPPDMTEDEALSALGALELPAESRRRTAPPRLRMESAAGTDTGRERSENQDRYYVGPLRDGEAYVVADGMGGMGGGDVAAQLAVDAVARELPAALPPTEPSLRHLVEAANDAVVAEQGRLHPQMGTTLTVALVVSGRLHVAHTGDSRCYLVREGKARQVTLDQTVVQKAVRAGLMTPEQARRSPQRHVIASCIGCTTVDLEIQVAEEPLRVGDGVVLCSDGLYDLVRDDEIASVTRTAATPRAACEQLIKLANGRGGHDNITVIVARVREGAR